MKKKLSLIYKILIVIASAISLYLNFKAFSVSGALIYYTVQSNLLCFIFYIAIIILYLCRKLKKNNVYYILKGLVTMAITITFFVYWLMVHSSMDAYIGNELACIFAHLIVPLLVMSDYAIFGEKGNLKKNYPYIWSITLICYVIFDIIYVLMGGTFNDGSIYPYLYMNVEKHGILQVIFNCLLIYVFFIGYGTIVQTIDNKLGKKNLTIEDSCVNINGNQKKGTK